MIYQSDFFLLILPREITKILHSGACVTREGEVKFAKSRPFDKQRKRCYCLQLSSVCQPIPSTREVTPSLHAPLNYIYVNHSIPSPVVHPFGFRHGWETDSCWEQNVCNKSIYLYIPLFPPVVEEYFVYSEDIQQASRFQLQVLLKQVPISNFYSLSEKNKIKKSQLNSGLVLHAWWSERSKKKRSIHFCVIHKAILRGKFELGIGQQSQSRLYSNKSRKIRDIPTGEIPSP